MKTCKKCGYTRKETDFSRDDECPNCGIIYHKFERKLENLEKINKDDNVVGSDCTRKGIKVQTFVLLLSAALMLLMITFPPFYVSHNNLTYNLGYMFLLTNMKGNLAVNTGLLLTQFIALFFLTLIAFHLFKNSKKILWDSTKKTKTLSSHADPMCQRKPEKTSGCGAKLKRRKSVEIDHTTTITPSKATEIQEVSGTVVAENASEVAIDQSKTFMGGGHHPWRRFFARTVDVLIIGMLNLLLVAFLVGYLFPQNLEWFVKALENQIIVGIIAYLLWLPAEAGFLAATGTTPAKWVFGISVVSYGGKKLSYASAIKRSFLVWIQGEGLGIPLVTLFTRLFAYRRLTKTGTTLWDTSVGSVVTHKKWGVIRATASVLTVLVALMIMGIIH